MSTAPRDDALSYLEAHNVATIQEDYSGWREIKGIQLEPTRLYFVDNSRGFGHRDEVPLQD